MKNNTVVYKLIEYNDGFMLQQKLYRDTEKIADVLCIDGQPGNMFADGNLCLTLIQEVNKLVSEGKRVETYKIEAPTLNMYQTYKVEED